MVEFVDDDEIIVILVRDMFREIFGLETLDGNEELVDSFRMILTSDEKAAEGRISHDAAEGRKALLQQLFPVRNEKKSGLSLILSLPIRFSSSLTSLPVVITTSIYSAWFVTMTGVMIL